MKATLTPITKWLDTLPTKPQGFTSQSQLSGGKVFVALKGEKTDGHQFIPKLLSEGQTAGFVLDQNYPLLSSDPHRNLFYVSENPPQTHRDLAAEFRRRFKGKIIGIGGSSGKTSTKEFLFQILCKSYRCFKTQKSQNGELGIPKTLEQLDDNFKFGLIEIGIDAPGDMSRHANLVKPDIAILTSIGEEHLNLLHTIENVFTEEKILFEVVQKVGGLCFAPAADPYLSRLKGQCAGLTLVDTQSQTWQLKLTNPYAQQNALLAAAVAQHLGMSTSDIQKALLHLELPEGRGREIALSEKRLVVADHYNANPSSLKAGLAHLHSLALSRGGPKILILGDMLDLGTESAAAHHAMLKPILQAQPAKVVLVGPEFKSLLSQFSNKEFEILHFENSSQASALEWSSFLPPNSTTLLKGSRGMKMEIILEQLQKLL